MRRRGLRLLEQARQEKEDLEKQREAERGIVKTAMAQLKSLQTNVEEKDVLLQTACRKMKELRDQCAGRAHCIGRTGKLHRLSPVDADLVHDRKGKGLRQRARYH